MGNEGKIALEIDGQAARFLLQSARLSIQGKLTFEGEKVDGISQFQVMLELPEAVYVATVLDSQALPKPS